MSIAEPIATPEAAPARSLSDPAFKAALQQLRQPDNTTNWYYILRAYVLLALVVGGTLWFYAQRETWGLAWAWNIPITIVTILVVGAIQHQLSAIAHEAVHRSLFRNRYLNELAGDLLAMFPMFSSLHHYRLQHWAHHQFVNDPDRDPDLSQLRQSGHWLKFPQPRKAFLRRLIGFLWLPSLFRFMKVRAKYSSTGTTHNPYLRKGEQSSKLALRVGFVYTLTLVGSLIGLYYVDNWTLLAVAPLGLYLLILSIFFSLPDRAFHQTRIQPLIGPRTQGVLRLGFLTTLCTSLAWLTVWTREWVVGYFLLLWIVPIFTSFSLFMILRQVVQHGNGGRGFLNNTRTFLVHPLISFSVFPLGQDYHLPHHMYSTVPHYNLKKLHALLLEYPEYQHQGTVVEGYFFPPHRPPHNPTVLDVLERTGPLSREVYIDEGVLEEGDVDDLEAIRQEEARSREAYQSDMNQQPG